jgi:hypothetical protein
MAGVSDRMAGIAERTKRPQRSFRVNQDLYRLVYYSRNQIRGDAAICNREIRRILQVSQSKNEKANITGALLYNAGSFAQVLEGPRGAIEATFGYIERDRRHSNVVLLGLDMVDQRSFESWSMAFAGADQIDGSRFGGIALGSCFDPIKMTAAHIVRTLSGLMPEDEA